MYDKDFDIYKKPLVGVDYPSYFMNKDRLGKAGTLIYNAFSSWAPTSTQGFNNQNEDPFFEDIASIHITSQQRKPEDDKYINSHTRDLACDFFILPINLMPYFAGKLFKLYGNNIYISTENGHIHFDIDPGKDRGLSYQKSVMVEVPQTKIDGHIYPIQQMKDKVLSFYGVTGISIQRRAPGLEDATNKVLTDTTPIKPYVGQANSKLDQVIEKQVNTPGTILNKAGNAFNSASNVASAIADNKKTLFIGFTVLALLIIAAKYIPTQLQDAIAKKLNSSQTNP